MELGAFSMSLNVKDLQTSREFYEKLGFAQVGGDPEQHWLILRNGSSVIGLFEGMFERNVLTFNPGWDQTGSDSDPFTDIREIQQALKQRGVELMSEVEGASGPGSCMCIDPDGNPILIDQHRAAG